MTFRRNVFAALAALSTVLGMVTARAASPGADFTASLIVAGSDVRDPQTAWVGLDVNLGPGWHTYWRSPGDAGAAPTFDWSKSRNVQAATVEWPAPQRFSEADLDTFGYAKHVLFPIKVRIKDQDAPAQLHLDVTLYVCSQICTSNALHFDADLTPGFRNSNNQILIDDWRNRVPGPSSPTIKLSTIALDHNSPPSLRIGVVANPPLHQPDVFISGDDDVTAGHPNIHKDIDGSAIIDLPLQGLDGIKPVQPLTATLVDGQRSIEIPLPHRLAGLPVLSPDVSGAHTGSKAALLPMIAVALLGGLVLNFMPCVFPVLSLKLFSLSGYGTHNPKAIRAGLLATAAGVVVSFMVLAGVLAGLKLAGAQVGWGLQFQQPVFLVVMVAILTTMTANLLGLFEIRLPSRVATKLDQRGHGPSLAAQFFNGFVMTALATPCSAPFVGTAVAFALSQATAEILLIFVSLGLGMASPYLALAAIPQLAFLFPRPGRWMLIVRQIAAAAIGATAIWLLSVLANVAGLQAAVIVGGGLSFLVLIIAALRKRFVTAAAVATVTVMACAALIALNLGVLSSTIGSNDTINWRPLVPRNVQTMADDGRTVFVDVGAAWCLTCKVNETLIIDSKPIRNRLEHDVVPVRGDWTKPNDEMAAYLRSFGRYGLPFNVVFGPGAPRGIVLPELLTEDAVLKAFNIASQHSSSN